MQLEFDATGARLEEGWLRCVKNSAAPVPMQLRVKTALYRHRWTSKILTPVGHAEPDNPPPLDLGL
jgi:hypothetical protein